MNIQKHLESYMGGKGLHEEKLTLFGRPLFKIPEFFQILFFKHDIHHMITGFGTDLLGEAKLLCWEVGAGTPWYYFEKYSKLYRVHKLGGREESHEIDLARGIGGRY